MFVGWYDPDKQKSGRITIEEAMANSDSPTNLHWLISNAGKAPGAPSAEPHETPAPKAQSAPDDLSSIKLNLDALG